MLWYHRKTNERGHNEPEHSNKGAMIPKLAEKLKDKGPAPRFQLSEIEGIHHKRSHQKLNSSSKTPFLICISKPVLNMYKKSRPLCRGHSQSIQLTMIQIMSILLLQVQTGRVLQTTSAAWSSQNPTRSDHHTQWCRRFSRLQSRVSRASPPPGTPRAANSNQPLC